MHEAHDALGRVPEADGIGFAPGEADPLEASGRVLFPELGSVPGAVEGPDQPTAVAGPSSLWGKWQLISSPSKSAL